MNREKGGKFSGDSKSYGKLTFIVGAYVWHPRFDFRRGFLSSQEFCLCLAFLRFLLAVVMYIHFAYPAFKPLACVTWNVRKIINYLERK